jgi:hypothetical protein
MLKIYILQSVNTVYIESAMHALFILVGQVIAVRRCRPPPWPLDARPRMSPRPNLSLNQKRIAVN